MFYSGRVYSFNCSRSLPLVTFAWARVFIPRWSIGPFQNISSLTLGVCTVCHQINYPEALSWGFITIHISIYAWFHISTWSQVLVMFLHDDVATLCIPLPVMMLIGWSLKMTMCCKQLNKPGISHLVQFFKPFGSKWGLGLKSLRSCNIGNID